MPVKTRVLVNGSTMVYEKTQSGTIVPLGLSQRRYKPPRMSDPSAATAELTRRDN